VEFGARVRFRHPLARSAAYRSVSVQQRQEIHRALAEVTEPAADPDRRAWHQAQAAAGPDEEVAAELERSAGRAQRRGGLAAAGAFLERAALLTPAPRHRAEQLLTAARSKRDAGELETALRLLVAVEAGPLVPPQTAEAESLRGQIASYQGRDGDAARLPLRSARSFGPLDVTLCPGAGRGTLTSGFSEGRAPGRTVPGSGTVGHGWTRVRLRRRSSHHTLPDLTPKPLSSAFKAASSARSTYRVTVPPRKDSTNAGLAASSAGVPSSRTSPPART
jgi:hypothetical protein